jgi:precorrin-6B methylase 1
MAIYVKPTPETTEFVGRHGRGRFPKKRSKKVNGNNYHIFYLTTRDFKNFKDAKLLYKSGFNAVDATVQNTMYNL